MTVGVYASPMPADSVTASERLFVVRSQRYNFPSSLLTMIDLVDGSTAAVLMHHSRTAFGNCARYSGSGVGPATVRISFMTGWPFDDGCGSAMVALGSSTAILLTPSPPSSPA